MKKIVMAMLILLIAGGTVFGERARSQFPKNLANTKITMRALDFEIRNIGTPRYINCAEPFLIVSVEVWNIGNKDYDPAQGQAVLYCDLHDADTNAVIRYFDMPMDQMIKAGQFQKWTIPSSRQQIYSQFLNHFTEAKFLQMSFVADEQAVTQDANWTNNLKGSRPVSTKCTGSIPFPIKR